MRSPLGVEKFIPAVEARNDKRQRVGQGDQAMNSSTQHLSGPVLRDTARPSQRYCALWGFWCLNIANWVRYPLPLF